MILWNCKNPIVVLKLFPELVPDDVEDGFDVGWQIYNWIKYHPDDCFLVIALKDNQFKAFVFAHKRDDDLFIYQAKSTPGFRYGELVFRICKRFARGMGLKSIKIKPRKGLERFYSRKYNFRPDKGEMVYDV